MWNWFTHKCTQFNSLPPGRSLWTLVGIALLTPSRISHGKGLSFGNFSCKKLPSVLWPVGPIVLNTKLRNQWNRKRNYAKKGNWLNDEQRRMMNDRTRGSSSRVVTSWRSLEAAHPKTAMNIIIQYCNRCILFMFIFSFLSLFMIYDTKYLTSSKQITQKINRLFLKRFFFCT